MKNRQASSRVRPQFEELEPRILYSADAGALLPPDAITTSAEVRMLDLSSPTVNPSNTSQTSTIKSEIVFVDSRVKNYQQLIDDITSQNSHSRHIEVQILDSHLDGVQQITDALAGRKDISAIHLIAEGNTAELLLGNSLLNQDSINNLYAKNLAAIGNSLTQDADILVYGCNFGRGAKGELAMQTLADLTGADIAASNDRTGHSTEFANWNLEVNIGNIETDVAVSAWGQKNWFGDLSIFIVSNTNDSGIGSFRQAVINANSNAGTDTVAFVISGTGIHTINLLSTINVTETVIIDGTTDDSFFANGNRPIIVLNGGGTVQDGIQLYTGSSGSTIRGIVFQNFTQDAIDIASSDNNTIVGNWIGLNTAGTGAAGNQQGVNIWDGSNNTIGGTTTADRNIISGNTGSAIFIGHDGLAPSNNNQIIGNYIGTNVAGDVAIANIYGIYIQNSANTIIGSSTLGAGNVISASTYANITLNGSGTTGSKIQGNYIGTNAAGSSDIDGTIATTGTSGVIIDAGAFNNLVGTDANGTNDTLERNIISGNNWFGVEMMGLGTSNNVVQGNYIGTDVTGQVAVGNSEGGTAFWDQASNNQVGSGLAGAGNVISANITGVLVANGAFNNKVQGNIIGLAADGTTSLGNTGAGVYFYNGGTNINVTGNVIGTDADGSNDTGECNIISNNYNGVALENTEVTANTVAGNYIGTDITGTQSKGNLRNGVLIQGGASNNTIGGINVNAHNVISGNVGGGIVINDETSDGNSIQGNWIGVNATGTGALGNGGHGVYISNGADNTLIGGSSTNEGNWIASPSLGGIFVIGDSTGTQIQGNRIGTDLLGTANWGTGQISILLENGASQTMVGGTTAAAGNIVANAGQGGLFKVGIAVIGANSTGNAFLHNSVYNNLGLGIDLGNDGVSINDNSDADIGANNLQNFPVLTSAQSNGIDSYISGTLNSTSNTNFRVEFFSNTAGSEDPTGYGEGQRYLGFIDLLANPTNDYTFNATLTGVVLAAGERVTATATVKTGVNSYANTSEFAMNVIASAVNQAPTGTDGSINTIEDTPYIFTIADFGFSDTNGNNFNRVYITSLPTLGVLKWQGNAFAAGNFISGGDISSGNFTYEAPTNANGNVFTSFTFQVADDGGTANGGIDTDPIANTLTINVSPVNDAPAIVAPANEGTNSNQARVFSSANGNPIIINDIDVGTGIMNLQISVINGTLTLSQVTGLSFSVGDGISDNGMTFQGSFDDINAALEGLTYQPTNGYTGFDTLTISVDDLGNTGSGGALTSNYSFDILVDNSQFLQGNFLEVGINSTGSIGALTPAPVGFVNAGTNLGVIADSGRDGWATYNGDYILPGTPVDEWGVNINGTSYYNSTNGLLQNITGSAGATTDNGTTQNVLWSGATSGLNITNSYSVSRTDLFIDMNVTLTNTTGSAMTDIYYYRNVDPDNNANTTGIYETTNTILSQGDNGSGIAFVSATQADGSYMGLQAFGANAHVAYGGFSNINPIDAYAGTGGHSSSGSQLADVGIQIVYKLSLAAGESVTLNMRYCFDSQQAPKLDLDANDSNTAGSDYQTTYVENATPVRIVDSDATLMDIDSANLQSMTATISNIKNGVNEILNADTTGTSIFAAYNNGVLTLTGNDTVANYEQVLRTITYTNTSENPDATQRIITIVANDGINNSNIAISIVNVTAVNDEPTTSPVSVTPIAEDSSTRIITQAELLINAADIDSPNLTVTGLSIITGAGNLVDNGDGTWTYTPQLNDDTAVTFSYSVTDGSLSASGSASLDITPVNDAPSGVSASLFASISEDDFNSGGKLVSDFTASTTDPDTGSQKGIAVYGADNSNGQWQYTLDGGSNWVNVGTVSANNSLLLASDALTRVRFVPNANFNALVFPFSYRAWDQTTGVIGGYADTSTNGGSSAFSTGAASVSIAVSPVNDAPVLSPYGPSYNTTEGATPITTTVATLLSSSVTDVDAGAIQGVALYAVSGTGGLLEYSIDGGSSWLSAGSVSSTSALVLRANDLLRFTTDNVNGGTMRIDYRAWDQSVGITGTKVDASITGGTSEFSVANDRVTVNSSSVNDAPTATIIPTNYSATEQTLLTLHGTGLSIADVDAGSAIISATISVISGTLNASAGTTGVSVSGSGGTNITLIGTTAQINDLLNGNLASTLTYIINSDVPPATDALTLTVDDLGNTGSGGALTGTDSATINITPVNDAPTTSAVTLTPIAEDSGARVITQAELLANGADVDGPSLSATGLTISAGSGSLVDNGNGTWTYTPALNDDTAVSFSYSVTDGTFSVTGTASLDITPVNDAAIIIPAVANLIETNAPLTTGGTLVISDVDSAVTFTAQTNVAGSSGYGTFNLASDGTWTYTANTAHDEFIAGTTYTDSLTVTSADGTTSSINVNILGTNDAAVISPAVANLIETNAPLTTSGTLAITDVDSAVTFATQTNVAGSNGYGTFNLASDGTWTYTANTAHDEFVAGTTYTDSLTVTSADGTTSNITVNILGTNDAAVITPAVANLIETNAPLTTGGTLVISDMDSAVTFTAQTNVAGSSGYGTFNLASDGSWTYTANTAHDEFVAGTTYTDSLTVTSADGTTSSINVNILGTNDAPTASNVSLNVLEDNVLNGFLPIATDAEGATVIYSLGSTATHGSISVGANGAFSYTPNLNYNGADSFTYTINDGNGGTNTYTVSITVISVNNNPTASNASINANEDTPYSGTLPIATDVEGDPIFYSLNTGALHGTVNVNAAGDFTYAPSANYNGADSFTYTVTDSLGGANTYTISIAVAAVNDAPLASDDSVTGLEDNNIAGNVLTNDSDIENSALTAILVSGPANGTLNLNANGSFTYTPNANWNGTDTFTYKANDGSADSNIASVTITVTPQNDAPTTSAVTLAAIAEDSGAHLITQAQLLANALDVDGNSLTATNLAISAGNGVLVDNLNGTWTYTPASNDDTVVSFSYSVTDGSLIASGLANLDLTPVNDAPTGSNLNISTLENTTFTGTLPIATDIEGDPISYTLSTGASHGSVSINTNGSFSYTPVAFYSGADSFTYTIDDGNGGNNTYTVTINSINVNDPPTASNATINAIEDTIFTGTLPAATDLDNDPITYTLNAGALHGTVSVNANGNFTYVPTANYNGADNFTYTVSDGLGGANTYTITINVAAVNDAPIANSSSVSGLEDSTVTDNVLTNDSDIDSPILTAILVAGPTNGTLNLNANGSFTYTPNANWNGTDTFSYKDNDGIDNSNVATFTIVITPINDAPTTGAVTLPTILKDSAAHLITQAQLLANALDVDGDALSAINLAISVGNGVLVDNTNGTWTYTPGAKDESLVTFSYTVTDGTLIAAGMAKMDIVPAIAPIPTPTPTPITPIIVDPISITPTPKPFATDPSTPADVNPVNKPSSSNQAANQAASTIDNNQNIIVNLDSNAIKNANSLASRLNQQDAAFSIIDLINLPSTSVSNNVTEIFKSLTHTAQIQINAIEFAEPKSSPAQFIGKIFFDNKIALTSVAVSAGLVAWAAQYGILFSSVLATLPAWKNLDPVAILGKDDDDEDTEWDMSDDENDQAAEENAIEILSEKAS